MESIGRREPFASGQNSLYNVRLFCAADVAEQLGVTPAVVRAATRRGELGCVRLSRAIVRYRVQDVVDYLERRAEPPASVAADGRDYGNAPYALANAPTEADR